MKTVVVGTKREIFAGSHQSPDTQIVQSGAPGDAAEEDMSSVQVPLFGTMDVGAID